MPIFLLKYFPIPTIATPIDMTIIPMMIFDNSISDWLSLSYLKAPLNSATFF